MDETNSLIDQRKAKLASLRAKGIDPFKNKFTPDRTCNDARSKFDQGELAEGARVSARRMPAAPCRRASSIL